MVSDFIVTKWKVSLCHIVHYTDVFIMCQLQTLLILVLKVFQDK